MFSKWSRVSSNFYQNSIVIISKYYYVVGFGCSYKCFGNCSSCKVLTKISMLLKVLSSIISHFNSRTSIILEYLLKAKPAVAFGNFCDRFQFNFKSIRDSGSRFHTWEKVHPLSFLTVFRYFLIWDFKSKYSYIITPTSFHLFTNSNFVFIHLTSRSFFSSS